MSTRAWIVIVIVLAVLIFGMTWILFTTPAHAPTISGTQTATTTNVSTLPSPAASSTSTQPLDTQVTVTTPTPNSTVSHSFEVAGTAPSQWFFEAVFPIQVRDPDDDLIGSSQGQAQGDWTQPGLVTFTSHITIDASYHGPANLIVLKDNPSGDPETMDSVTIPITIQ